MHSIGAGKDEAAPAVCLRDPEVQHGQPCPCLALVEIGFHGDWCLDVGFIRRRTLALGPKL